MSRCFFSSVISLLTGLAVAVPRLAAQDSLEELQEQAIKVAVARVAPSVVQIETSGGTDILGSARAGPLGMGPGQVRKGTGPTTGLVVASDGYIISSAFNFADKPAAIFVAVPGHPERLVARVVATDHTRMLTLLKIDAQGLPVPAAVPKQAIRVGQWALALGRTWSGLATPPSVSVGIVSALGRVWGKAIQTDAKVSPINYGGPLVDLSGRVLGVLVPLSPRGQDETAGVEWYDSGIGFAIPLEDINRVMPQLRQGKDLKRGLLGITPQSADLYSAAPVIGSVAPDSAAARAGIKPGDIITAINGKPIVRQAQVLHALGEKYEGDSVSVKVRRGKQELGFANLKLTGELSAHVYPFLGILPMRDDPELGEEVRYVFPKGPADAAGLKAGDRILRVGLGSLPPQPFSGRDDLTALLNQLPPGTELKLEVQRKGGKKTETLKVPLGVLSEVVPDELPEPASRQKALAPRKQAARGFRGPGAPPRPQVRPPANEARKDSGDKKKPETGVLKRTTPAGDHQYWLYVPEDYDPNIAYALVVWLHPQSKGRDRDRETETLISAWEDFCSANHLILFCPRAESEAGWVGSETEFVLQTIEDILARYTIDRQRVVAHGMGVGGQMAYYLGFHARDVIRGVATVGAALTTAPKNSGAVQRLAFFLVAGGKDPLRAAIVEGRAKLAEQKFPVVYREIPELGHQYLDAVTLRELVRWIDSLDRQ